MVTNDYKIFKKKSLNFLPLKPTVSRFLYFPQTRLLHFAHFCTLSPSSEIEAKAQEAMLTVPDPAWLS